MHPQTWCKTRRRLFMLHGSASPGCDQAATAAAVLIKSDAAHLRTLSSCCMSKSDGHLSWLQVPTDSELLLATLKMERSAKLAIPRLPSTFPADIATIMGTFSHVPIYLLGALSSPQSACEC